MPDADPPPVVVPPPRLATIAVHGAPGGAVAVPRGTSTPVHHSAAFDPSPGRAGGRAVTWAYSRVANPTVELVAARVAALERVEAAALLGSGSAALLAALLAAVPPGGRLVASRLLCADAHRLLTRDLPGLGRAVTFVDLDDIPAWRSAVPGADALFVEALSNPMLRVADLPTLAALGQEHGALLVVDATLACPVNICAAAHGADLVVHSATKVLNGHSDVTAGAVAGSARVLDRVRPQIEMLGACLDPAAAFLLERGLKTLVLRVERQNATALLVAEALERHPAVATVSHPHLRSHPDEPLARRLLGGSAGMVTIRVGGGDRGAARVVRGLGLIRPAPTLGGVESLAVTASGGSPAVLDAPGRRRVGILPGTIRLSLGVEDARDLLADLDQALRAAHVGRRRVGARE
jgi:cystathionine beta-lyase/cystathionine gamma-synthase